MKRLLIAAAASILAASAQAAPVFSDDFNSDPTGLNTTPAGWNVTLGTVDTIGTGFFDLIPGSGNYIDLDGSTNNAGVLAHALTLTKGTHYVLSFDLAGNHRDSATEHVLVEFGTSFQTYSLPESAGWTHYTLDFTPLLSGTRYIRFSNAGGDNIGMLLDNVNVAAVPEPETYAMLLAGLGMVGLMVRRRTTV